MSLADFIEVPIGPYTFAVSDDTARILLLNPRVPIEIVQIGVTLANALSVAATNYATFSIINQTGTVTIATFDTNTGGQAFTAGVPVFLNVVAAAVKIAAGDRVTAQTVDSGTGRALTDATIFMRYRRLDEAAFLSLG